MADLKPSTAPAASALDGTELIPCSQGGASAALTTAQIRTLIETLLSTLTVDNLRLNGNTIGSISGDLTVTRNNVTMLDIVDVGSGVIRLRFYGGGGIRLEGSAGINLMLGTAAERFVFGGGNGTDWYAEGAAGASHQIAWAQGDFTGVSRGLRAYRSVEANVAGSGAPNVLAASETRRLLTNEGAAAENYHTLPTAAAGLEFIFYVQDGDGIRVVANAGDTIRIGASVSAAAGFVRNATVGSVLHLVAINATEWIPVAIVGTWTVDV